MKFKCKQTGCEYEFLAEHDIEAMLTHPQYEVVEPKEEVKEKPKAKKDQICLEFIEVLMVQLQRMP